MEEKVITPQDLATEPVEIVRVKVDDKGGVMFIGSLTADEYTEWGDARNSSDPEARKTAAAGLIIKSLVKGINDPTRIGTMDMVPLFRKARIARTERLLKAVLKLNGINQPDEVEVKNA